MDSNTIRICTETLEEYGDALQVAHDAMGPEEQRLDPVDNITNIDLNDLIRDTFYMQGNVYRAAMASSAAEAKTIKEVAEHFAEVDANMTYV